MGTKYGNPNSAVEFWRQGIDLWTAAYELAPLDLKQVLERPLPVPDAARINPPPTGAPLPLFISAFADFMRPLWDAAQDRASAMPQVHEYIASLLEESRLLAFGYVLPRRPDDMPVPIPADIWSRKIDWRKSEVSGNIVPEKWVDQPSIQFLASPEIASIISKRPSLKIIIPEAYRDLEKSGAIDFSAPMTRCYNSIRAHLAGRFPEHAGYFRSISDETIRKLISAKYQADKKSKIQ
jgi:hypothetical protein